MPITVNYNPNIRALGRTAQFAGEGAYRQGLNQLASSDADRNVSTQLSLLGLVEGARQANLQAFVSRSNMLGQQQQQQAQSRFGRQSSERMALFGAAQSRQQQQASAMMNAQAAAANFRRQQSLGQDQFGQQQQLGEQKFGFAQQLQEQQDQALDERQQAQFRQAENAAILQTLDPQTQSLYRANLFKIQKFKDDEFKRPTLRKGDPSFEYENGLQQLYQQGDEILREGTKQPSLEEQFQQGVHWRPDDSTGVNYPWVFDQKSAKFRVAEGWKPPEQADQDYSVSERDKIQMDYNVKQYAAWMDYQKPYVAASRKVPQDFSQWARDYENMVPRQQFPQGNNPYVSSFTGHLGGAQQDAPPAQQEPPQQMQQNPAAQQQAAAQRQIQIQTQQLWEKYAKPKGISMLQWTHTWAVIPNDRSKLIEGQVYTVHTATQESPGVWVGDRFVVIQRGA